MTHPSDDFYVGYLPMSRATSGFTLKVGVVALVLAAAISVTVVLTQTDPRDGATLTQAGRSFRGLYHAKPYPHLTYLEEDGSAATLLFVKGHKAGLDPNALEDGAAVEAAGTVFERGGSRMMAGPGFKPFAGDADALRRGLGRSPEKSLGEVRLEGEVVDSKCFLGAMRPGVGKTHRACAQLCIAGGIPPFLVIRGSDGAEKHVLLCSPREDPLNEAVLPYVAEIVGVRGELVLRAGMLRLKCDFGDVERL